MERIECPKNVCRTQSHTMQTQLVGRIVLCDRHFFVWCCLCVSFIFGRLARYDYMMVDDDHCCCCLQHFERIPTKNAGEEKLSRMQYNLLFGCDMCYIYALHGIFKCYVCLSYTISATPYNLTLCCCRELTTIQMTHALTQENEIPYELFVESFPVILFS